MSRRLMILALCSLSGSCGQHGPTAPMPSMTGVWEARVPNTHTNVYYLSLVQNGSDVQGTACHEDNGPGVIFRGIPVSGVYPTVLFTVTLADANDQPLLERFTGRLTGSGQILGTMSSPYASMDLTFTHLGSAVPAFCSVGPA